MRDVVGNLTLGERCFIPESERTPMETAPLDGDPPEIPIVDHCS